MYISAMTYRIGTAIHLIPKLPWGMLGASFFRMPGDLIRSQSFEVHSVLWSLAVFGAGCVTRF